MTYEITGGNLPVVICTLDPGETMKTQSGGMSWMNSNMRMSTKGGGIGKMFGRVVMGESAFQNFYTAEGGQGLIAFASSFPGAIIPFRISRGQEIVIQRHAFLASEAGVELTVQFQRKLRAGFFGGEGFIMERLSGNGMAFAEMDGSVTRYELGPRDRIIMDTGYLAAMSATCSINIESVPGIKNVMFGGEGLFNTIVNGPGEVWIQSIPIARLSSQLAPYFAPRTSGE